MRSRYQYLKVLVVVLILISACKRQSLADEVEDKTAEEPPELAISQFVKEELYETLSFGGTLEAKSQETVYSPISGQMKSVFVDEGTKISQGQKLFVIRPDAEGLEFKDHIVYAPTSGVAVALAIKAGTHVDKNQNLVAIANLSSFKITIYATVDDLPFITKVREVDVLLSPEHTQAVMMKGLVQLVSSTPDVRTKTFPVKIDIPCPSSKACHRVYPGLLARIEIKKNRHMGFKVPFKYIRRQEPHLLIVNADLSTTFVPVKVGQYYGQDIEILEGIDEKTRVVTTFTKMPQEGQKVKIISSVPEDGQKKG